MTRIVVLDIDRTGKNPDNKIVDEEHHPLPGPKRLIVPLFGAFFKESLVVKNAEDGSVVSQDQYEMGDLWSPTTDEVHDGVYTCFILKEQAPVAIKIDYQAFGGQGSRNAKEIVNWLNERLTQAVGTKSWKDLKDIPKKFNPEKHLHLLSHVYGMEFIVDQIKRAGDFIEIDRFENVNVDYDRVLERVDRLYKSADIILSHMVKQAWDEWKKEQTLYTLGVDLLNNYPALGKGGVLAGKPEFVLDYAEDNRYVDLHGLGLFSKSFIESVVTKETGLGLTQAMEKHAMRGSLLGATVGETFILPSPRNALKYNYADISIYPKGWDYEAPMVVVKEMTPRFNHGGVFSAFDLGTNTQYIGVFPNGTWSDKITWSKCHMEEQSLNIEQIVDEHIARTGNVHQEDKEQIGLGNLENLPVVPEDNILTREPYRGLVTMDTLLAFLRAHMENIRLERKENGKLDYQDTMEKVRVIINGGDCSILKNVPPKDQFIESFCDGQDKWVRLSDGTGKYYDKRVMEASPDCGAVPLRKYGEKLFERCQGFNLVGVFSDGTKDGTFTEIIGKESPACGYQKATTEGTVLATYCSGVNQYVRYADGNGGSYDMPKMIDTYICGGKIYPAKEGSNINIGPGGGGTTPPPPGGGQTPGGGSTEPPGGGQTPQPGEKRIDFRSTHNRIKKDTTEIWEIFFYGLIPQTFYGFQIWEQHPNRYNGQDTIIWTDGFLTDASGNGYHTQNRTDDGYTMPRGRVTTWATILGDGTRSNTIYRDFVGEDGQVGHNNQPGNTDPDILNIDGQQWNPPGGPQPPRPKYNPILRSSSNLTTSYYNDVEIIYTTLENFFANKTYELIFMAKQITSLDGKPLHKGGAAVEAKRVKSEADTRTNNDGFLMHISRETDIAEINRGKWEHWVRIEDSHGKVIESEPVTRSFLLRGSTGPDGTDASTRFRANISSNEIKINQAYHVELLLDGLQPSQRVSLEMWRFNEDTKEAIKVTTATRNANPSGHVRWDVYYDYNGSNPEPGNYSFMGYLVGEKLYSSRAYANFSTETQALPAGARLTLSTNAPNGVIEKGLEEIITVRLENAPPGEEVTILGWAESSNFNDGAMTYMNRWSGRVGSNGVFEDTLRPEPSPYDGRSVQAGLYFNWASIPKWNLKSEKIRREFRNTTDTGEQGQLPDHVSIVYQIENLTEPGSVSVKPNQTERHTITFNGLPPNYQGSAIVYKDKGTGPIEDRVIDVRANDSGYYQAQFNYTNNGLDPGTYSNHVRLENKQSNYVNRILLGSGRASLVYEINGSDRDSESILRSTSIYKVSLTGAQPNRTYLVKMNARHEDNSNAVNNGTGLETGTWSITTGPDGSGSKEENITDSVEYNGQPTVPRGTWKKWAEITELGISSNIITVSHVLGENQGPGTGTEPTVHYSSSHQENPDGSVVPIRPGIQEVATVQITGYPSQTEIVIEFWVEDTDKNQPFANNGRAFLTHTINKRTSSNGEVWERYTYDKDNGVKIPRHPERGTRYKSWLVVKQGSETLGTSNIIFRKFEPTSSNQVYNPKIVFESSPDVINVGTTETFTFRLTGFKPHTNYTLLGYVEHPSYNKGKEKLTITIPDPKLRNERTDLIRTDFEGKVTVNYQNPSTPYDGSLLEGKNYKSWVVVSEAGVRSNTIIREMRGKPIKDHYRNIEVEYKVVDNSTKRDKTRTQLNDVEEHVIVIRNAAPRNRYLARIWNKHVIVTSGYKQFNKGLAHESEETYAIDVNENGVGTLVNPIIKPDRGEVPGGTWESWIVIDQNENWKSRKWTREFVRNPLRIVSVTGDKENTPHLGRLWAGVRENYTITMHGGIPGKTYEFELFVSNPNHTPPANELNGWNPRKGDWAHSGKSIRGTANNQGVVTAHWDAYWSDNSQIPHFGFWKSYVKIKDTDISTINTPIRREYLTHNPSIATSLTLSSSNMDYTLGYVKNWPQRRETFTVTVTGAAGREYNVRVSGKHVTSSTPGVRKYNNGAETPHDITGSNLNSRGNGVFTMPSNGTKTFQFSVVDLGPPTIPRGTWETYVFVTDPDGVERKSNKLTRVFLDRDPSSVEVYYDAYARGNRVDKQFWPGKQITHQFTVVGPPGRYVLDLYAQHVQVVPGYSLAGNGQPQKGPPSKLGLSEIAVTIHSGQTRAEITPTQTVEDVMARFPGEYDGWVEIVSKDGVPYTGTKPSSASRKSRVTYKPKNPNIKPSLTLEASTNENMKHKENVYLTFTINNAEPNKSYYVTNHLKIPTSTTYNPDNLFRLTTNSSGQVSKRLNLDGNRQYTRQKNWPSGNYLSYFTIREDGQQWSTHSDNRPFYTSNTLTRSLIIRTPSISHSSNKTQVYPNDTETHTITISNGEPYSPYEVKIQTLNPVSGNWVDPQPHESHVIHRGNLDSSGYVRLTSRITNNLSPQYDMTGSSRVKLLYEDEYFYGPTVTRTFKKPTTSTPPPPPRPPAPPPSSGGSMKVWAWSNRMWEPDQTTAYRNYHNQYGQGQKIPAGFHELLYAVIENGGSYVTYEAQLETSSNGYSWSPNGPAQRISTNSNGFVRAEVGRGTVAQSSSAWGLTYARYVIKRNGSTVATSNVFKRYYDNGPSSQPS